MVRLVSPKLIEQITIVDASGRVLKVARANSTQVDVDVNTLKPGMYIVRVKHQGGVEALRFIKKQKILRSRHSMKGKSIAYFVDFFY